MLHTVPQMTGNKRVLTKKNTKLHNRQNEELKILRARVCYENEERRRPENYIYLKVHVWTWRQ
jgi:hypothetical protein